VNYLLFYFNLIFLGEYPRFKETSIIAD